MLNRSDRQQPMAVLHSASAHGVHLVLAAAGKMELLDLKVTRHGVLSVKEVQAKVNNQKPPPFIPAYRPDFVPPGKAPKSARDQARVAINQQMKDMEQCIQNPQVGNDAEPTMWEHSRSYRTCSTLSYCA